jgi:hypothetical protein
MKYASLLLVVFLFSCDSSGPSSNSTKLEQETLDCWSESWTKKDSKALYEGFEALDDYLFSKGYIGNRNIEDYKKFANDTYVIQLSPSVENFDEIALSYGSSWPGAPDLTFARKCFHDLWFVKMDSLNSTDALLRIGKLVKELIDAGDPSFESLRIDFFKNLTIEEFNRPLIKSIYYFMIVQKKIKFTSSPSIPDPNAPSPPPPPVGH